MLRRRWWFVVSVTLMESIVIDRFVLKIFELEQKQCRSRPNMIRKGYRPYKHDNVSSSDGYARIGTLLDSLGQFALLYREEMIEGRS